MDFGPHSFFSEDQAILDTIMGLFDDGVLEGTRNVRLFMRGKYLQYPLNAADILLKLGVGLSVKCTASYLKEKIRPIPDFGVHGPKVFEYKMTPSDGVDAAPGGGDWTPETLQESLGKIAAK